MSKTLQSLMLASLAGTGMIPAHAGLLTYQGVTFNSTWAGNVLTLEIDAAGRRDGWARASGLAALELDDIGNYTSASVAAAPAGASGWAISNAGLNAKGCSGGSNGQAGNRLCFSGQQIALADDMVFSFTFNGNAVRTNDPHVKVQFVDSKGKKVGDLLSQLLPASPGTGSQPGGSGSGTGPGTGGDSGTGAGAGIGSGSGGTDAGTPQIPPLADQSHDPITPTTGNGSGSGTDIAVPEPQGTAVLLAGLGLMGLAGRRKRHP